jgi:hypothetical protein
MSFSSTSEERQFLLNMVRPCLYTDWLLLELPNGKWGAFWAAGFTIEHCSSVAEGNFSEGCSAVCDNKEDALQHMFESYDDRPSRRQVT